MEDKGVEVVTARGTKLFEVGLVLRCCLDKNKYTRKIVDYEIVN